LRRNFLAKSGEKVSNWGYENPATSAFLTTFAVLCGILSATYAVMPPPDGGYPGGNTAEGQNAFLSLTSGGFNTAIGYLSLRSDTVGAFNTVVGAGTLLANTADQNTANGAFALISNTSGESNTATGVDALSSNTEGTANTGTDAGFGPENAPVRAGADCLPGSDWKPRLSSHG
jgi:hypothetical protein